MTANDNRPKAQPLCLYFCDHYELPLPQGHRFPATKYRLVREGLQSDCRFQLREAPLATEEALRGIHGEAYIEAFLNGSLEASMLRRIGFPWSPGLVTRTLASVGGTMAATRHALITGFAGTIAGGTHHAFRNEGAGYCIFNDLAVSAEWARQCAGLCRIAIVDLDVHQGDGTANIFENNEDVYTLSLHGSGNFPFRKQRSRVDIEFPDGITGRQYLSALEGALEDIWLFEPELVLFQSGVDTLESDRLGRLSLTLKDLAVRDRLVLEGAAKHRIPIVTTMGGGYSEPLGCTVEAHLQTFRTAADIFFL